jgi:hypothetical protein
MEQVLVRLAAVDEQGLGDRRDVVGNTSGWNAMSPPLAGSGRGRCRGRCSSPACETRRRQLAPLVATGTVACCRCGLLIQPHEAWHLDHRDDRAQGGWS